MTGDEPRATVSPRPRRTAAFAAAGILLALLWWFGGSAWGGWWIRETSPAHDTMVISTLYGRWAAQVGDGDLPLWFPEFAGGYPVHAAWMYGILYPPLLVFTVLPLDVAWTWLAILHILFGALGAYAWFWEERRDAAGAATAAVVFALSGFVLGRMVCGHLNVLMPFAWVPWTLRAALRAARGERSAVAALGLCAGLGLLAGHVQIWFYAGPLAAAYGLSEAARRRDGRAALRLAAGAALALAISAIQWIPAWELFDVSGHPAQESDLANAGSVSASALAAQFAPRFAAFDPLFGHEHFGLAGPLAAGAALLGLRLSDRRRWLWCAVLAAGLVLATGVNNPVGEFANQVPPLRWSRVPGRALCLVVLAGSLLSGHCVADWFAAARNWIRALVPAAFAASGLAFGLPSPELVRSDFRGFDWTRPMPEEARRHRMQPGMSRLPYVEACGVRTMRDVCPLDTPGYKALQTVPLPVAAWWFDVIGKLDLPWRATPADAAETVELASRLQFVKYEAGGAFHTFGRAQSVSDDGALARMRQGERALFLPPGEPPAVSAANAQDGAVRVERPAPDRIEIALDEGREPFTGFILLAEKWYPGWAASRPEARVLRANLALLCVRIDPGGRGGVSLVYRPWWRVPALAFSAASLLLTCLVTALSLRGTRAA